MNSRTRIIASAAAIGITTTWLRRRLLVVKNQKLQARVDALETKAAYLQQQLDLAKARYAKVPAEIQRRLARQDELGYRLPADGSQVVIETPIGQLRLVAARGYFGGTAIFVYTQNGAEIPTEVFNRFTEATNNEFRMHEAPISSSGGDSSASGFISAGLDYHAYMRGEQGYFKRSPAPTLVAAAETLSRVINELYGARVA